MNRIFLSTNGSRLARAECAENGRWAVELVLDGVAVRCMAADPHNPNKVFAGTQGSGVLRSEDRGKTWQPSGMQGQTVKSIAVSPAEPGLIVAGTKPPGVFVSRDGGHTWSELESFRRMRRWFWRSPAEKPFTAYVQAIALSPTDSNVIVAGIEAGAVVRSTDGGKTWQPHRDGALRDCHSITFHASNGDWVYEGGGTGAGAAFSRDAGNTWTQTRQGLDRHYGWAAAADPARPEVMYVSVSPGPMKAHSAGNAHAYIFRSTGDAWEKLGGGLPQPLNDMPYALLTDHEAPGHVYAGLSNGDVWHSADYGDYWQQLPVNVGTVWTAMIMF
ncbi:MAG: hypothetical protein KME04_14965 [Pleurocapsa minor GSE-CHR-MK-17-07R]|jgi:photosystem II stability/assembly factor-like uncharacterized protein|nr:hypothetical protein [Pleurocapsa minor GSE-CHR-MK 17-07R]